MPRQRILLSTRIARILTLFSVCASVGCLGAYEPLPEPLCGNGTIDEDEQCDDANGMGGDGCQPDCTYSGAQLWSKMYDDGKGTNEVQAEVAIDSTGHIYVVGYPRNRDDYKWLQRYTPDGKLLWTFELPIDSEESSVRGLAVDSADRAVVTGSRVFLNVAYVMSVTADAKLFWAIKPETVETLGDVLVDVVAHAGKLYSVGRSTIFDDISAVASPLNLITFSEDGKVMKKYSYTPESDDEFKEYTAFPYANGITVATDGALLVAGGYSYFEVEVKTRALLVAFEPSGALRWEERHTSPYGSTWFNDVRVDAAGQVIATRTTQDTAIALQDKNYDQVLLKYDAFGKLLWTTSYDSDNHGSDYLNGMIVDSLNNIVTVGYSASQAWLRKTSPDGRIFWTRTVGDDLSDSAYAVAVNADDSIVVAGFLHNSTAGGNNGWLAKYTP